MATVNSMNRLTGMYSGIDTDAAVKAMGLSQQGKIDALSQKKQQAEWKKDLLTDFNNKLRVFRDTYGSVLGDKSLMLKKSFVSFDVKIPDTAGVRITPQASAKSGAYSVRVDQIATAASVHGAKLSLRQTGMTDAELNTAVGRLTSISGGAYDSQNIEFSINGVDFTFTSGDSLKKIMDTVNKSKAGVTMSYTQSGDRISIVNNELGAYKGLSDPGAAPFNPGEYAGVRPVRGSYPDDASYQTALAAYNSAAGNYQNTVAAQYKADLAQWEKDTADYTADSKKHISFQDSTGFLAHLGLTDVVNGQDAVVYINGETEARHLDVNTLTLDGVQMTFIRPTGEQGVDYTLEAGHSQSIDIFRKFVEDFNALIKELHEAYNQKVSRDYKPLTEDHREQMTEKEIDLWEAKAKEGLLYRDYNLNKLLEQMRGVLSKQFGENGNLSSIGITVGRYMVGEPVQIELDEDKLMAALETDTDRVFGLMTAAAGDGAGGLMVQLNKMMDDYVGTVKSRDIKNLTDNITDYSKKMKEQETKLAAMTEKYYLQYAKLETALAQMQSQQDAMSSMFGLNTNK